ncbi:MAG: hypothetical protein GC190_15865 [Alphaproteobacteria bacterium]|nr:hypothetical protein [Alphaproteobacteria bacterium]
MVAAFGLPHVLSELRYVDERFSARSSILPIAIIGALVGTIAALRIATSVASLSSYTAMLIELALGGVLALAAAWFMRKWKLAGVAVALAFGVGVVYAPIPTFLVWAWLHNLTPLGFVTEATEGDERRRLLLTLSIFFLLIPALVATGVFHQLAFALTGISAANGPSAFGAETRPLGSFLWPGATVGSDVAIFSAAVVAQAMHYTAVILFLPRLITQRPSIAGSAHLLPWPRRWSMFAWGIAGLAAAAFVVYAVDYSSARSVYGVAAAIHAWLELPVFLLALGGGFTAARR